MNRLQTLRECVYTQKTRTCTCYSVLLEAHADAGEGMRFVFDSTPDCEVIHGALYSCLRAMFGLSVSGILVCIFSCMLVYQLLRYIFLAVWQFRYIKNVFLFVVMSEKKCTGNNWNFGVVHYTSNKEVQ